MLQWFGGLGIVVVAMVFLPTLKVGGMQLFRSEAFDTLGKILPRAGDIALSLTSIYLTTFVLCFLGYVHGRDGALRRGGECDDHGLDRGHGQQRRLLRRLRRGGALRRRRLHDPRGAALRALRAARVGLGAAAVADSQVRAFLVVDRGLRRRALGLARADRADCRPADASARCCSTSSRSITGTGYTSTDYKAWGPLAMTLFFVHGADRRLLGLDRLLGEDLPLSAAVLGDRRRGAAAAQPSRVFIARYEGRQSPPTVMDSVIAFFMLFYLTLAVSRAAAGADRSRADHRDHRGRDARSPTSVRARPGDRPGRQLRRAARQRPSGCSTVTMLVGRLEIISVLVLFTVAFWRGALMAAGAASAQAATA